MIFSEPVWVYIVVFSAGLLAYVISTLSGGGSSLLLVPVEHYFSIPLWKEGEVFYNEIAMVYSCWFLCWTFINHNRRCWPCLKTGGQTF
jgi:hypothetical protein